MIVVRLRGGLGNQLFQYAAGRRLSWVHGTKLKLDHAPVQRSPNRTYGLHAFDINAEPATAEDIQSCCTPPRLKRSLRRLFGRPPAAVSNENSRFDPAILKLPNDVCLDGYWQSERYFTDVENLVRRELRFRQPPTGRNLELAKEISSRPAVSLHVRRGDYLTNPVAHQILGLCGLDYYHRAVERIGSSVNRPHYYVFSDDSSWVRQNLKLNAPVTVVDHNGSSQAHEDLRLMSLCCHHVIANSSFSWWGAWLAEGDGVLTKREKIIIAPRRWFRSEAYRSDELLPNRWMKL